MMRRILLLLGTFLMLLLAFGVYKLMATGDGPAQIAFAHHAHCRPADIGAGDKGCRWGNTGGVGTYYEDRNDNGTLQGASTGARIGRGSRTAAFI